VQRILQIRVQGYWRIGCRRYWRIGFRGYWKIGCRGYWRTGCRVLENRMQRILENRVQRKMFGAQEEVELTEMWKKCHSEEHNAVFSPLNNMEAKRMRLSALVARIIKTCTNRI
jgi:hypothetical protein